MLKQSHAVLHFTKQVLGDSYQEGLDVKTYCTDAQRAEIADLVTDSILAGETFMKDESRAKYSDRTALRRYVVGMVKNWFDKSKTLNGGSKHVAKAPGSRVFQKDEVLKNLRIMRKQLEDAGNEAALAECDAEIASRIAELDSLPNNVNSIAVA
jgi:hypothetical protein